MICHGIISCAYQVLRWFEATYVFLLALKVHLSERMFECILDCFLVVGSRCGPSSVHGYDLIQNNAATQLTPEG